MGRSRAAGSWLAAIAAGVAALSLMLVINLQGRELNAERAAAERWERHTLAMLVETQRVEVAMADMQRGVRGYLIAEQPLFLAPWRSGRVTAAATIARLRRLSHDNLRQQRRLAELTGRFAAYTAFYQAIVDSGTAGDFAAGRSRVANGEGERLLDAARRLTAAINAEEQALLVRRSEAAARAAARADHFTTTLGLAAMALALASAASVAAAVQAGQRARLASLLASEGARFRALSDTLPALVFVTDAAGANIHTNTVFQQTTGLSGAELLGDGWLTTVHPDDRARATALWAEACRSGQPYEAQYRFRIRDGSYRWYLVRGTPVHDADGAIVQWVGAALDTQDMIDARDAVVALNTSLESRVAERTAALSQALASLQSEMTERAAAEGRLRQIQRMEAVGALTGGIAHDFNNMLSVVMGWLDHARRRLDDRDRLVTAIDHAIDGARRAAQLTERLLAFSRQSPLQPEPIDVNQLVSGMSQLLARTLGDHVHIETRLAPNVWPIAADVGQLENALLNLCVNARDAMPDGGTLTIVTGNRHEPDGEAVAISVTDSGVGMTAEVVDRAFDPFFTTKDIGKGTGLGLSQVFGFVKQSGGHVGIASAPGQGTTVTLSLPRHVAAVADASPAPAA